MLTLFKWRFLLLFMLFASKFVLGFKHYDQNKQFWRKYSVKEHNKGSGNLVRSLNEIVNTRTSKCQTANHWERMVAEATLNSGNEKNFRKRLWQRIFTSVHDVASIPQPQVKLEVRKPNNIALACGVVVTSWVLSRVMAPLFPSTSQRRDRAMREMAREAQRETEYRENMYFEAAAALLAQLEQQESADLSAAQIAALQSSLDSIDPDMRIRDFLSGRSTKRPSLDDLRGTHTKKPAVVDNLDADSQSQRGGVGSRTDSTGRDGRVGTADVAEVLSNLRSSVAAYMTVGESDRLFAYLQDRLDNVVDSKKKQISLERISDRLGDIQYWKTYVEKIR